MLHWFATACLFLYCTHLEIETRKLGCQVRGLEWAQGMNSLGYCKTPGLASVR